MECWPDGLPLGIISKRAPAIAASARALICSRVSTGLNTTSMSYAVTLFDFRQNRRLPHGRVVGRLQIVCAVVRHREFTRRICHHESWPLLACKNLLIDLFLQSHERVQQSLRAWRAAGNVHVHGNVTVNALQHVVSLFERPTGNSTSAHRDD